jgi:hypothetical protein
VLDLLLEQGRQHDRGGARSLQALQALDRFAQGRSRDDERVRELEAQVRGRQIDLHVVRRD